MASLPWTLRKRLNSLMTNLQGSVLLLITTVNFPRFLLKKTCQSLSTVEFSGYHILKIIRNINPNKAHGHDMISIRMLKIYDEFICETTAMMFRSCLQNGSPQNGKIQCGHCL